MKTNVLVQGEIGVPAEIRYREVEQPDGRWHSEQKQDDKHPRSTVDYASRGDLVTALAFNTHEWTGWSQ